MSDFQTKIAGPATFTEACDRAAEAAKEHYGATRPVPRRGDEAPPRPAGVDHHLPARPGRTEGGMTQ